VFAIWVNTTTLLGIDVYTCWIPHQVQYVYIHVYVVIEENSGNI
jgi:hypothetical protein